MIQSFSVSDLKMNWLNWVYSILGMCSVVAKLTQLKLNLLFWSLYPTMSTCTSEHIWIYCFDPLHIQLRVLVLLLQGFLSNELVKACDIICQRLALWPHPLADRWESNSLSRCQASCISQLTLEDIYCRSMAVWSCRMPVWMLSGFMIIATAAQVLITLRYLVKPSWTFRELQILLFAVCVRVLWSF
jgi:hypothetical protein